MHDRWYVLACILLEALLLRPPQLDRSSEVSIELISHHSSCLYHSAIVAISTRLAAFPWEIIFLSLSPASSAYEVSVCALQRHRTRIASQDSNYFAGKPCDWRQIRQGWQPVSTSIATFKSVNDFDVEFFVAIALDFTRFTLPWENNAAYRNATWGQRSIYVTLPFIVLLYAIPSCVKKNFTRSSDVLLLINGLTYAYVYVYVSNRN
ncbi:hypothetical protein ALC53_04490 [Atta colombica]|uniref:Uncharacterized protein n=1 Tax=Atta colombica TaxID=520822 RepID=A0A195BLR5_9HYME|nr:hypothetical protein ALC53_04490 [Atta colombica]